MYLRFDGQDVAKQHTTLAKPAESVHETFLFCGSKPNERKRTMHQSHFNPLTPGNFADLYRLQGIKPFSGHCVATKIPLCPKCCF